MLRVCSHVYAAAVGGKLLEENGGLVRSVSVLT